MPNTARPAAEASAADASVAAEASPPEDAAHNAWRKGWVWNTRKDFKGWKHLAGNRDERRSAPARARRAEKRAGRAARGNEESYAQHSEDWGNWTGDWEAEEAAWREWREDAAQNLERVDEAEEEEDARSYASARSGSSYSYSSDSSSGGEDRIGAAAKETVPQQPAARSTEKTSGGTTADAAPHGACDEVKSEADTLSALRAQVVSAIERNDGADFQAALAANPKQVLYRGSGIASRRGNKPY